MGSRQVQQTLVFLLLTTWHVARLAISCAQHVSAFHRYAHVVAFLWWSVPSRTDTQSIQGHNKVCLTRCAPVKMGGRKQNSILVTWDCPSKFHLGVQIYAMGIAYTCTPTAAI